ncbi:MAG: Rrf2 family transcriptional regulator [Kiritimatiellia bacterium]|nr:Rrf2 family transcriptional regulator [Kiritimatiellia bacterium]
MKVSTKGRYGVRFLLDLALHDQTKPVSLNEIAKRQDISEKYLWQIAANLKSAGLVSAVSGKRGGFYLAKPPENISLQDILEILEGNSSFVNCVHDSNSCKRSATCIAREMWTETSDQIADVLASVKLADLVAKAKKRVHSEELSYII